MSDIKIGQIIVGVAQRDAIHMAVAPVVAGEPLEPGQHVGLVNGKAVVLLRSPIGIVDPFLRVRVNAGETCWIFLYPGTIKGLRHEWSHPAFEDTKTEDKAESESWLRAYAARLNPYDEPERAYQRLIDGLKDNEVYAYGQDLGCLRDLEDADELKSHAERVLGIIIRWDDFSFRCSC